jgi:hypothetical protein
MRNKTRKLISGIKATRGREGGVVPGPKGNRSRVSRALELRRTKSKLGSSATRRYLKSKARWDA